MRRAGLAIIMAILLFMGTLLPDAGQAESKTLAEINRELEAVRRQMKDAQRRAEEAERQIAAVQRQIKATEEEYNRIMEEKQEIEQQIVEKQAEIDETEAVLADTEVELQQAIERIEARDELLKSRLVLTYMNGSVSYLEVLLKSTSFADFLDRYNSLRALIGQDREILESNKRDKVRVEEKKAEIEDLLVALTDDYNELTKLKDELNDRMGKAQVMIAQLRNEQEHLEHVTAEEEQLALAAAARESELLKEQERLKKQLLYGGGALEFPLPLDADFRKSSDFGTRVDPITGQKGAYHAGVDLAAPKGTKILAAAPGIVITAGWNGGYGNTVIINHGTDSNGRELWTLYAHASKVLVKVGQEVKAGQVIAEVGSTGRSTGNHLHFGVYLDQQAVDPKKYIKIP
jgi:murein DD-endopeptidase MepM/ murein hydrolase activator NlpD